MITINSKRFGEMEFSEDSVIKIIEGLIGLDGYENFVIIRYQDNGPFHWLQCVDNPDLALVMINPLMVKPDYDPNIPLSVSKDLDIQTADEVSIFVIVTIPAGKPQDMTANLLAPLIINVRSRLAKQLILDDRLYSHRFRVMADKEKQTEPPALNSDYQGDKMN